jgi:hypothetical protein
VARHRGIGSGRPDPLGAPHTLDARGAHESGDLVAADVVTGAAAGLPGLAENAALHKVAADAKQRLNAAFGALDEEN